MTTTTEPVGGASGTPEPSTPVTAGLARLALAIRDRGLTAEESHATTRAIVDWFSATIAGFPMAPGRLLTEAVADTAGDGPCRLVPSGQAMPVRTAALINATASHTAELDDIYRGGIYHPGSPTVGAALALAEHLDVSGADLIRAVAIGYEVGDRVSATVNPAHYRFWHTTGTVGTLGAAAAAAELLGLDADRFAHALATATTMAAGLQQAFRSDAMSKPLHAGHAADAGLLAALSARRGFTGALDVLEGPAGFGAGMAGSPDWSKALADPGRPLGVTAATVKNHSCCGHTFAAVDAALRLRANGLSAEDIDSVEIRTYTTATKVAGNPDPRTAFEAKFSASYCVAAAFHLGSVRLRAFEPEALADASLRDLMRRTTVAADEEMERLFPDQRHATVTVRERSGATRTAERHTRKGDPDDPLTDAELGEKFDDLVTPVLGASAATTLSEALWSLADLPSVRDLPITTDAG
jgi:2-methylcitrate dehydratase PrpD